MLVCSFLPVYSTWFLYTYSVDPRLWSIDTPSTQKRRPPPQISLTGFSVHFACTLYVCPHHQNDSCASYLSPSAISFVLRSLIQVNHNSAGGFDLNRCHEYTSACQRTDRCTRSAAARSPHDANVDVCMFLASPEVIREPTICTGRVVT